MRGMGIFEVSTRALTQGNLRHSRELSRVLDIRRPQDRASNARGRAR